MRLALGNLPNAPSGEAPGDLRNLGGTLPWAIAMSRGGVGEWGLGIEFDSFRSR